RNIGIGKKMRDGGKLLEAYQAMTSLGKDLPDALEILTAAARPILERWFEAEVLRATRATDGIIRACVLAAVSGYSVRAAPSRDGRDWRGPGRVGLRAGGDGRPGDSARRSLIR